MQIYSSADVDGPGTMAISSGELIRVLDACLITGYTGKPALGWVKEFSATNRAVYKSGDSRSTGFRLYVDDTDIYHAFVRGYESMSDIDTGEYPFPNFSQFNWGLETFHQYNTNNSWVLYADELIFYLIIEDQYVSNSDSYLIFGDYVPLYPHDRFNCIISASHHEHTTSSTLGLSDLDKTWITIDSTGKYLARDITGFNMSQSWHHYYLYITGSDLIGRGGFPYPYPLTNSLLYEPVYVLESSKGVRGILPGVYSPLHTTPLTDQDTFEGRGTHLGKTFKVQEVKWSSSTNLGQVFFDLGDWRA